MSVATSKIGMARWGRRFSIGSRTADTDRDATANTSVGRNGDVPQRSPERAGKRGGGGGGRGRGPGGGGR